MNRFIILALLTSALVFAGCDDEFGPEDVETIEGAWDLASIQLDDGSRVPVGTAGAFTANFQAGGALNARADCNTCNGTYTTDGFTLSIANLACTRAFCGENSSSDDYIQALQSARSYVRIGNVMQVQVEGGGLDYQLVEATPFQ